jgi:type III restriction enzyme
MDKGAHFHQCDFQVHTPRDANWNGAGAVTATERKAYANELIRACRQKDIRAIAITDHHDFAFFPYIKVAAQLEVDAQGQPIDLAQRLIVFPGIELTLSSPPCQALLLLDSEFDETKLDDVLKVLTIEVIDESKASLPPVDSVSPASVTSLRDLEDKLNQSKWLKGRFIVFPNVTDGGYKTLMREGFAKHYQNMPCVGGYVDGQYSKTGDGKRNFFEGRQQNNGFQPIAVMQTSDNRRRDHADLGKAVTWIKWSEPTAEALRQACLAKASRLCMEEPTLPGAWIVTMKVSSSKFLGPFEVDLNQQYNAVIGGRGTGKSTILEYLRWGLCDQPIDFIDSELGPVQTRRKKLVEDTLQKYDGEIIVTFVANGVLHIVKRNSKSQSVILKIGDGEFAQVTEQELRNVFPLQAYSQKQLSSVGIRIEELRRFVELPIKQELDTVRSEIRGIETRIRTTYANLTRKRELEGEVAKYTIEIESLSKQVATLRKGLKGLSEKDEQTIGQKSLFENELTIVEGLRSEFDRIGGLIAELAEELQSSAEEEEEQASLEILNPELIEDIRKGYRANFKAVDRKISEALGLLSQASTKDIQAAVRKWERQKTLFDAKYEDAKTRAKANQQVLSQIREVEKRLQELNRLQTSHRKALKGLGNPESLYSQLRTRWSECHVRILDALGSQCVEFSQLSNSLIKADIKGSLDVTTLKNALKQALAGLNVRETRFEEIWKAVATAPEPMKVWEPIVAELESLVLHRANASQPLPATPILNSCEFTESERRRIVAGCDNLRWLDLSLTELQFNPVFQYCTNKKTEEFISFADASAGQQATALLTVLLNQSGGPLVIDQPEDDLDSKMSSEIVEQIWTAKTRRQLIFASHNANLVVNGDAELVIGCDYRKAGDQTGGRIGTVGAIDNPPVRDEITSVTEGGKEAFKLRKAKYGF